MRTSILTLAVLALMAVPTQSSEARRRSPGQDYANPSAVIAAEFAFVRLAQDKGQWTAFRATATRDAVIFMPQLVYAQVALKDRADPPKAVVWQPHQVWSSCDGSLAVTRGAWQRPDGSSGYYTTVWQRQQDGKYKWVLDQGDSLPMPLDPPEIIVAKVADCPPGHRPERIARPKKLKGELPPVDPARRTGQSLDGTLTWEVTVNPDGARHFVVTMVADGQPGVVEDLTVEAPPRVEAPRQS